MKRLICTIALAAGLVASPYIGHAAKVIIDPGHGGSDPGAVGINGLYEKTVNTDVSLQLRQLLLDMGYEAVLTRDSDRTISLQDRVDMARNAEADLFVSVHSNAHPDSSVRGTMVLYHDAKHPNPSYPASVEMTQLTPQSRHLAQVVLSGILEQVPNVDRGLVPSSAYVVRNGNIPSILVELAFLSNAQDAKMLESSSIRGKYARGIANGIMKFLPPTFSDIGAHWAKESIVRLNDMGIANGQDGKFYPDRPLTRAELVAFAERSFGLDRNSEVTLAEHTVTEDTYGVPKKDDVESGPAFTDLSENHWAYPTLSAAIENGVIRGYPDGTVRPDAPVSRAEVAVVLDRLIGSSLPSVTQLLTYKDVNGSSWAFPSIMRLTVGGIVHGIATGLYGPDRSVTRAEMATMVDRQLSRATIVVSGEQQESDNL